ncbi:hypothetical protein SAMN04490355_10089 [Pelosinus propionicus DSM 13327]|uniref:Uncharacterized protein n=1 Tax=Pelosinus propionicus DSM 13327 TaxID=1123291 RepID=A0A1I4IGG2_9FIRM|nr:hypothetical protein SAMN04490355_10089 [Pelosinus propionicus DSM 13327]
MMSSEEASFILLFMALWRYKLPYDRLVERREMTAF